MKRIAIPIFGGVLTVAHAPVAWYQANAQTMRAAGLVADDDEASASNPAGMTWAADVGGVLHIISGVFDRTASQAAHEAAHCTQFLAEHIGMDQGREVEACAYLTQWFFERLRAR